ncbi:6-bladed beta-propeller [Gemmatimonadota bacterium]
MIIRTSLVVLTAVLAACSSDSSESGHSFRVFEENGITVAETLGGPKYEGELFEYEQILTLKEDVENPDSFLFRAFEFWMDEDDYIYVADSGNNRIAVFDPEGNYVRQFGREGEGPGEFRSLRIQSLDDGVISIWDSRLRRATLYRTDGTYLETITPLQERSLTGLQRDENANLFIFFAFGSVQDGYHVIGNGIRVYSASGDTLCEVITPAIITSFTIQTDDAFGTATVPYCGKPEALLLRSGEILISTGMEPRIALYNLSGEIVREVRVDLEVQPITDTEKRATQSRMRQDAEKDPNEQNRAFDRAMAESVKYPDHKAFWTLIHEDSDGYMWLSWSTNPYNRSEEVHYRLLSPEGEYLGETVTPTTSGQFQQGRYLTRINNEETGQRVPTIFSIRPIAAGLKYP